MEKAIELAEKSGWHQFPTNSRGFIVSKDPVEHDVYYVDYDTFPHMPPRKFRGSIIREDPAFYNAVAKGFGWKSNYTKEDPEWGTLTIDQMEKRSPRALARACFEHIMDGKDPDEFFTLILKLAK